MSLNQTAHDLRTINGITKVESEARAAFKDFGVAGLDLSASRDLTALVLVFPKDGEYHIVPHFWLPEDGLRDKSTEREGPLGCMGAARVFDHHRRASHPARGYCFGSG